MNHSDQLDPKQIQLAVETIDKANSILLITHVFPDGDALGSLSAVAQMLQAMGKQVTAACEHPPHPRFSYLPFYNDILTGDTANNGRSYDLIVSVDCSDEKRMGIVFQTLTNAQIPLINIDHHVTNTNFGTVNLILPNATSTVEILYLLIPHLNVSLNQSISIALLTGLVTDTLCFRIPNVSAQTLKIASDLIAHGANLYQISQDALVLMEYEILKLWQVALNNMKLENGLLWSTISNKDRLSIGYHSSSSAGLSTLFGSIYNSSIGCILLEYEDSVYVSFRSREPYDVAQLAFNLGGGGHPRAAGCQIHDSLDNAEHLVVSMAKETIIHHDEEFHPH